MSTNNRTLQPKSTGAEFSTIDIRDYKIECSSAAFPESFELETVPVKNQGSKPTCTAHAGSLIVEYFNRKQEDTGYVEFSTNYLFSRRETGKDGKGMSLRDLMTTLYKYGNVYKEDAPGNYEYSAGRAKLDKLGIDELDEKANAHRISSYYRCYSDDAVKEALMNHGYVVINMPTYSYRIVDDFYTPVNDTIRGYHAVIIYGWDDTKNAWKVQNSWGATWAEDGRFLLPYDYPIVEYWGASDNIVSKGSDIKKPCTLAKLFAGIYNLIANLLIKK